ncbi:MAG: hypothetical protein IT324_08055 [Anaerolineae bacterium]|nr:hypothetical protein [Anaerolineae bacterium]
MNRTVRFRWPQLDAAIQVALLDDLNPNLVNDLWTAAPLMSIQSHAVVAGQQMYFPTRLILPDPQAAYTEPMNTQPLGRINFEPFFQYISINYGPVSEAVPTWPVGQVVGPDIPKLAVLGKRIWENLAGRENPLLVIVEPADTVPQVVSFAQLPAAQHTVMMVLDTWQAVLNHLETETNAIWLAEPEDVRALRLGVNASDAGVYGQYFSPWIMVTGLTRSLAVVELASLVRLCRNPAFSVEHLATMLREMLRLSLGVIGYFGLPRLGASLRAVDQTVGQITGRDDFTRFIGGLLTYVNRYNLWLHQTFPWYLGTLFPKANVSDAQSIVDLSSQPLYRKH